MAQTQRTDVQSQEKKLTTASKKQISSLTGFMKQVKLAPDAITVPEARESLLKDFASIDPSAKISVLAELEKLLYSGQKHRLLVTLMGLEFFLLCEKDPKLIKQLYLFVNEALSFSELMTVLVEPSFLERVSQHTFDVADEEMAHYVMLARSDSADFRIV